MISMTNQVSVEEDHFNDGDSIAYISLYYSSQDGCLYRSLAWLSLTLEAIFLEMC